MASLGGTQDRRKELKMMLGRAAGGAGQPHSDFVYYPGRPGMSLSLSLLNIKEDLGLPLWLSGKEPARKAGATGDMGSIPGPGRSPEGEHGNPLQYSCLENPMDRGAWWATAHGVAQSQSLVAAAHH